MLTVTSPDLIPYTATGAAMGTLGEDSPSVGVATIESGLNPLLQTSGTSVVPPATGDSFTVALSESPSLINLLQIADQYYSLAQSVDSPSPGEFYYNPASQELTVYPESTIPPGTQISYTGLAADYGENEFGEQIVSEDIVPEPYPQFLSDWQVIGEIELGRNFRGHPSATCRFNAYMADEAGIRATLKKGNEVNLFGMGFIISNLTVVRKSLKKYPEGEIACEVQFVGKWDSFGNTERSRLDKPVRWKRLSSPKTSLAAIADNAGVPFSGEHIEIKNRSDTPSSAYTTFRQELESRAIVAKGFPFYSSPHRVEMRRWAGTTVHYLSDADLISEEVPISLPGFGAIKDGVQVVKEMVNVAFNPDSDGDDPATEGRIVLYEGNLDVNEPPRYVSTEGESTTVRVKLSLRENQAFDSGGETKTLKKITYENGTTLIEEEQSWGFVYAFVNVYKISYTGTQFVVRYDETKDLNLGQYWKKISESVRTYEFEEGTGYLKRITSKGYRLARFKSESSSLESVEIQKELTQGLQSGLDQTEEARLRAILATYTDFDKLPINDVTEYDLEKLSDYYSDIQEPGEEDQEDYIPPKFVRRSIRTDSSYAVKPDPESTPDEERPPLSTGKKLIEVKETNIVYPRTREKQVFPEIFRESEATSNQQGAFLKNVLNISYYKENKGRPGVQQRFEKIESEPNSATITTTGKYKTLFCSQGAVYENDIEQGSISFPGVIEASKARELAEIQLQQDNVSSETLTIQVFYNPDYSEGDLLVWQGVTYVILGIDVTFTVQNLEVLCDKFNVSLGRLLKLPVISRKVIIPS